MTVAHSIDVATTAVNLDSEHLKLWNPKVSSILNRMGNACVGCHYFTSQMPFDGLVRTSLKEEWIGHLRHVTPETQSSGNNLRSSGQVDKVCWQDGHKLKSPIGRPLWWWTDTRCHSGLPTEFIPEACRMGKYQTRGLGYLFLTILKRSEASTRIQSMPHLSDDIF